MNKFLKIHIFKPLANNWLRGISILIFWTVAFVTLPALSGWFLAASSVAFLTANTLFAYLIPSSIIRLLTLLRTASRYFERLENHKSTLDTQRNLQLSVFQAVARLPYFKKQINNNSDILENSTYGIDLILNHIILWILPLTALILSLVVYFIFLSVFSQTIAIEFLISSAILLFLIPQFIYRKNSQLYAQLKLLREENNQALIQSFRGRIEISKYNLQQTAIAQHKQKTQQIERTESKLQTNSFTLQLLAGLGFSFIAIFTLWNATNFNFDASLAIGVFFGIMAQAELAEMLFSGKSEKSSVADHINDLEKIISPSTPKTNTNIEISNFSDLILSELNAKIPETDISTIPLTITIKKGEVIAIYGETGKGKTTFLNSLFYPEYRLSGTMKWNGETEIAHLPIPQCVYVSQKAYLLTGTLRENFEGYTDDDIISMMETVDLNGWYKNLPNSLDTWIGENGETLSGGQRKKLLLAQALLKNPQLLVIDEPTAGISTDNVMAIFGNIKQKYPDITILMATHLQILKKLADKILTI